MQLYSRTFLFSLVCSAYFTSNVNNSGGGTPVNQTLANQPQTPVNQTSANQPQTPVNPTLANQTQTPVNTTVNNANRVNSSNAFSPDYSAFVLDDNTFQHLMTLISDAHDQMACFSYSDDIDATLLISIKSNYENLIRSYVEQVIDAKLREQFDEIHGLYREFNKAATQYNLRDDYYDQKKDELYYMISPSHAVKEDSLQLNVLELAKACINSYSTLDLNLNIALPHSLDIFANLKDVGFSFLQEPSVNFAFDYVVSRKDLCYLNIDDIMTVNDVAKFFIVQALSFKKRSAPEVFSFLSLLVLLTRNNKDLVNYDSEVNTFSVLNIPLKWVQTRSVAYTHMRSDLVGKDVMNVLKTTLSSYHFHIVFEYFRREVYLKEHKLSSLVKKSQCPLVCKLKREKSKVVAAFSHLYADVYKRMVSSFDSFFED